MGRPAGTAGRLQHNQGGTQTWKGLKASSRRVWAACDPNELPAHPALPDASLCRGSCWEAALGWLPPESW